MTPLPHIALQYVEIDHNGIKWYPYEVEYDSPEGPFCIHIYATSDAHADAMLQDLKESGRVTGQTIGVYPE